MKCTVQKLESFVTCLMCGCDLQKFVMHHVEMTPLMVCEMFDWDKDVR